MNRTHRTLQTTLENKVSCSGVGLHSGAQVAMLIRPAPANTGIVFRRTDVPAAQALIPARFDAVSDTRLGTRLQNRHGVSVSTVEHLMAAFWGVGIDNALVELNGPEVPIMDGSLPSASFGSRNRFGSRTATSGPALNPMKVSR